MPNPFASAKFRGALYALALAVFAVSGLTSEEAARWLNVVGAGTALLALVNVPWRTKVVADDESGGQ